MKLKKVNNNKGFFLLVGNTNGYKNIIMTVNGQMWLLNLEVGRLFSFTFWEKEC